ncbi:MAG: hypothetical protein ACSHX8_06535 [Opitutaceae bacterium]
MKILYTLIALALCTATLNARPQFEVATEENRLAGATEHLTGKPNQIAIFARGLVCSSCGIGLRIHLKKLDGIDKAQLDKGILLDAKNQLTLVAFESSEAVDVEAARKAVYKAGYEPTHYYQWDGESVVIHKLAEEK